ncbi:MAG: SDR family NAD(P)-dependent oxidoreductase [Myxococcota bacterium]
MRFTGKTILITGASLGVGFATAQRFVAEGANVVLCARRPGPLHEAAAELDAEERVLAIPCDVQDNDALARLVEASVARFGGLDGLVNNAGAHFRGPLESRSADEIGTMVDVNLRAPLVLTRLALPHLRAGGGGFVVQVASLAGKLPLDGAATYSSTKFGLRAFTYAMAEELRGTGVTVSAVSPGPIDTGFIMDTLDEVEDIVFSQAMCTANDVATMVLDCAADGKIERAYPTSGSVLATVGYLVPGLRRMLKPALNRKGARAKAKIRQRQSEAGSGVKPE